MIVVDEYMLVKSSEIRFALSSMKGFTNNSKQYIILSELVVGYEVLDG